MTQTASKQKPHHIIYLGLFLVLIVIYLAFPSQRYDADPLGELVYIKNLQATYPSSAHMLYVQMGVPAYRVWLALGNTADPLRVMQIINALFAAAAITLLALILDYLSIRHLIAIPVSLSAGLSYAFWTHTLDAFFIIPAACMAILALWSALVLARCPKSVQRVALLLLTGLSVSLSALFYQTNLLIIPALVVASIGKQVTWRRWFVEWAAIALVVVIVAGGMWYWQGTHIVGTTTLAETLNWFVGGHGGLNRGLWRREGVNVLSSMTEAWAATILPIYEGMNLRNLIHGQIDLSYLPAQLASGFLILTIVSCGLILWLKRHELNTILAGRFWIVAGLWLALPGLAVMWFDPAEVKLWLIPLLTFWFIVAAFLNAGTRFKRLKPIIAGGVVLLPLMIGAANFTRAVWPDYTIPSLDMEKASISLTHVVPGDAVLTAAFDWADYVHYLCYKCKIISGLNLAQQVVNSDDWKVKQSIMESFQKIWNSGHSVYVMDYFMTPDAPLWSGWITPYTGLTPQDFQKFDKTIAWTFPDGERVWKLTPNKT